LSIWTGKYLFRSGDFQFEFYSGHSLAHKGVKKVETVVHSILATTQLHYTTDYFR